MASEPEFELVMPFVTVASAGGPHDDDAYTAGWQMGSLDAALASSVANRWHDSIRSDCRGQADLIAMKHGWAAEFEDSDGGWLHMTLTRRSAEGGPHGQ